MSSNGALEQFQDEIRQIVEWVNAQLIEAGHDRLIIQATDFELDQASIPKAEHHLIFRYALGDDLSVKVAPIHLLDSQYQRKSFASDLAKALVNLDKASKFLVRYHRSVRAAANAAVKSARESGYRIKIVEVALKRTYAFHLTYEKWRTAADHVLATIDLEIIRADGETDAPYLVIEEPEDVAREIEGVLPD